MNIDIEKAKAEIDRIEEEGARHGMRGSMLEEEADDEYRKARDCYRKADQIREALRVYIAGVES